MSDDSKVQKTSISLSQELYDWANDQVKNKKYHSRSHLIEVAVAELKGRREGYDLAAFAVDEIKNAATEAIMEVRKASISNEYFMSILLTLATKYPELTEDINNLMKTSYPNDDYTKKRVTFK